MTEVVASFCSRCGGKDPDCYICGRSSRPAQRESRPVLWICLVPVGDELRIRAWTADEKRMQSLVDEGLNMEPLYRAGAHTEGMRRCPDISNADAWDVFAHARDAVLKRGGSQKQGELAGLHAAIIAAYDVMAPSSVASTDRESAA